MDAQVLSAIVGVAGGLVSGTVGAWVAMRGKGMDRELGHTQLRVESFEKTLFEERLSCYRALWALTEPTSRRNIGNMSKASAKALGTEMTRWYYQQGGILLTTDARDGFFHARLSLESFTDGGGTDVVVSRFSALRTLLCKDLMSREAPSLSLGSSLGAGT